MDVATSATYKDIIAFMHTQPNIAELELLLDSIAIR